MSLTFLFAVLQESERFTGCINSCGVTITGAAPKFLESKLNKAQDGRVEGDSDCLWPSQWAQSSKHPKEMEPTSLPQTKHYRQCTDRDPKSHTVPLSVNHSDVQEEREGRKQDGLECASCWPMELDRADFLYHR
ncbi:hypothetical protein QQF64_011942 [Cirrhinus molitorella]|uniref:Uncharacterized protein n=1 Tax=Cirrhinus molitorella TaxID=172907 RepID=A0ABR3LU19_9TELE